MGHDRRLAWLLGVDIATSAVGVVVLLAAHFFVVASGYFLLLAAMVAGAGLIMASGYRPLRAGRADRVVAALAVANYLIALAATAIAPFAMPILLLATMLPAVLAVPYVSRRQLHGYVGASFVTALGVAALGSLQDVTGFRDALPWWLESGVVVFFIPFMTSMVSIIALTNATVLAENVVALRASRARVVASAERERRRIERDLHDGAQQALVTAKVQLANLRQEAMRLDPTLSSEVRRGPRSASPRQRRATRPGPRRPPDGADGGWPRLGPATRRRLVPRRCDGRDPHGPALRSRGGASRVLLSHGGPPERLQARWRRDPRSTRPGRRRIRAALRRQRRRSRIRSGGNLRRHRARQHGRSARRGRWGTHRQRLDRWWHDNLRRGADLSGSSCLATSPNSSQRYLATRAGHLARRRPLAQCGPQH